MFLPRLLTIRFLPVFLTLAPPLAGCGRIADNVWPNTEAGRIELRADASSRSIDSVTHLRRTTVNGESGFIRVLSRTIPVGTDLYLIADASRFGLYRGPGGFIFQGTHQLGHYRVWTRILRVESSRPAILRAEITQRPGFPPACCMRWLAQNPGMVRITFTAQALDTSGRPTGEEPIEDAFTVTVLPTPSVPGRR